MRRMYGEERHISVLKAELENFIDDDEDDDLRKTAEFAEDLIKTKMMYTKNHGRAIKMKPHFRPIQTTPSPTDKNKIISNDTLKVKPLDNTNITNANTTKSAEADMTNNETIDDKGISYKTKLESIANIEINNLDPDVVTLEAVIKQSIETNSIYPNYSSSKSEPLSKNVTNDNKTIASTEAEKNNTESPITEVVDEDTTPVIETFKDNWKPMNADTSTLPPTLLFSEHDKGNKNEKLETNINEKKEEFLQKPHHQESFRPAVIKLEGA